MIESMLRPMFSFVDDQGNKVIAVDTIEDVVYNPNLLCSDFNVSRDKMTAVKVIPEEAEQNPQISKEDN
jgi:hypothetical protein